MAAGPRDVTQHRLRLGFWLTSHPFRMLQQQPIAYRIYDRLWTTNACSINMMVGCWMGAGGLACSEIEVLEERIRCTITATTTAVHRVDCTLDEASSGKVGTNGFILGRIVPIELDKKVMYVRYFEVDGLENE